MIPIYLYREKFIEFFSTKKNKEGIDWMVKKEWNREMKQKQRQKQKKEKKSSSEGKFIVVDLCCQMKISI